MSEGAVLTVEDLERIAPDFFACGIECGPGWHALLLEAAELAPPGVRAVQIKEKFGMLCVYVEYGDAERDFFTRELWEIERRSTTVCEECGQPGRSRGTNWILTRCDECMKLLTARGKGGMMDETGGA